MWGQNVKNAKATAFAVEALEFECKVKYLFIPFQGKRGCHT